MRIGLGLSKSSWGLLQRLKIRDHVDQLALTSGAASIIGDLPNELFIAPATEILRENWKEDCLFVVVGSIGAVIRLVAPLIKSKEQDPALVVLDARALNVVPLLGGHKAGADDFALQIAEDLGANPVFTSDSSSQERLPIDSFGKAWGWKRHGPSSAWSRLMQQQALGSKLLVTQDNGSDLWKESKGAIKAIKGFDSKKKVESVELVIGSKLTQKCCWHPATLWVGIGCERNTSSSVLERALEESFKKLGLAQDAIAGLATIDLKVDEPAIIDLAKVRRWPIRFFSGEVLDQIQVPNPSFEVRKATKTASVAEAAGLLAAGEGGLLIQEKAIYHSLNDELGAITIAIAESLEPFSPNRGALHLIGVGPGDLAFLTNDARFALSKSVAWFGYGYYLELLEPLRRNYQVRIDSNLSFEVDRCQQALNLAVQGVSVALVSSGDSGIYGMAGLALELLLAMPEVERPRFEIHPGVSAMQLAASRVGAPLMNDFCAISLSDCLTPWTKIKERLLGAAIGDFVVALYNPQSKKRDWQLRSAIGLLLEHRLPSTPVVLARQVGRPDESLKICTLATLPIRDVDMFTIVLIGNSLSFTKEGWFVTPRGYA